MERGEWKHSYTKIFCMWMCWPVSPVLSAAVVGDPQTQQLSAQSVLEYLLYSCKQRLEEGGRRGERRKRKIYTSRHYIHMYTCF